MSPYFRSFSGVTRDLSQGGQNVSEKGPLATVGELLANTQKKC